MPPPQFSPELVDVGLAIGLLAMPAPGGSPESATLNDDFFVRPDHYLTGVFTQPGQRSAILRIAERLVGPDGPPVLDGGGEHWIPIATVAPGGTVTSGLFLVATPIDDDLLLSLGGQLERTDDITLRLVARIPLFLVSENGAAFAPGTALGDVQVEATAVLGDIGPLSVGQITAAVTIPTDGSVPEAAVRLVRPPEGDPGDIVVTTTDPVGPQAARVLSQLVTALAEEAGPGVAEPLKHLLALLGLNSASAVPALPLEEILANGRAAVWQWLLSVFGNTSGATAWMNELAELLGVTIEGTGSTAAPWKLCFATGPVTSCLELSVSIEGGSFAVIPAVRVGVPTPATLGIAGHADLVCRLVRLRLGPSPAAIFTPDLSATITVGTISGATTLVSTTVPGAGGTVSVGALRTGLAVDSTGAALVLEAHRVTFPNVPTFTVLDLTDTDAVLDVGGAILDGALTTLLTALGDSPAARIVFVLLGLRRPAGTTAATWPHAVSIAELFSNPLDALRGFYVEVLAAGDMNRLVDELGGLLRAAGGAAGVTGAGTPSAPWTVTIASSAAGRADLAVWTTTGSDGTRLHLGNRLTLPSTVAAGGARIGLALAVELISLRLAGVSGMAADLDPQPLPSLSATLELGDDLYIDVGPIGVLVHSISAGIDWSPATGMAPRLLVDTPELVVEGATVPLPVPVWDRDRRQFRFEGEVPWPIIERLASQLLESMANEAAQLLPGLLGWRSTGARGLPAIPPPPGRPANPAAVIPLDALVQDPWRTVGRALVALLTGPQGREWAAALLGWVGTLTQGLSDDLQLTGIGATADPWAVPLTGAGRALELVVSVGEDGGALGGVAARLVPPELQAVIDLDDASEVIVDVLAQAIAALAVLDPQVAAVVRRNVDPAVSLAALRAALVDTDGVVPAAAQHGLGSAAATVNGTGQLAMPALFTDAHLAAGAPPAVGRIFARTGVAGAARWPGETSARTIDLTTPGLPPESFDLSGLPASGPWFVVLPTRSGTGAADLAAGHVEQVNRLRRVVDALRANRPTGSPLALIAHGPAGHVARAVAAGTGAGVTHLTLLGTSISTVPTRWADDPSSGDGLRLAQALRELVPAASGDLGEADGLLDLLTGVTDGLLAVAGSGAVAAQPYPLSDVPPPGGLPALPGTVATRTVAGNLDGATVDLALGRLVVELLRARMSAASVADELRVGVRGRPAVTTANGIRSELQLALDVVTLPLDFGDDALAHPPVAALHPRLRAQLRLDRPSGWLVGGPTGAAVERRDPRLRALDVDLAINLVGGGGRCELLLHDAAAFGIPRARWPLSLAPDGDSALPAHLTQEDRLLLGELATALGPRPATGALAALMDAVVALGLGTLSADGRLTLLVDPFEQLLLDARTILPALTSPGREALARAVAALTAGTACRPGHGSARHGRDADGRPGGAGQPGSGDAGDRTGRDHGGRRGAAGRQRDG